MKKQLVLMALLCLGSLAIAQKTETATKEYVQYIPQTLSDEGVFGFAVPCTETYHYYFDDNDNRIKHGLSSITGAANLTRDGITVDTKFSGTATYSNGKLSGKIQQSYYIVFKGRGESIEIKWSFNGSYVEGLPDGVWVYSETDKRNERSKKESVNNKNTVVFDRGKIKSITYSDGIKNQFDEEGNVSGEYGRFKMKNGVVTNLYKRKNGEFCSVDSEQTELINKYLTGEYTEQCIIDKGYNFSHLSYYEGVDLLGFFLSRVGNESYVNLGYLGGSIDPKFNNYLVVLNKIELKTLDEGKRYITNNEGEIIAKRYDEVKNNEWGYVSTEVKSQLDSYVMERKEAERQKMIQNINSCSDLKELSRIQENLRNKDGFSKEDVAMIDSECMKRSQELIPITEQAILNKIELATSSEELKSYYSREQKGVAMIPNKQIIESTYQTKYNELRSEEERIAKELQAEQERITKRENRVKRIKTSVETIVGVAVIVGGYLGYRYFFGR